MYQFKDFYYDQILDTVSKSGPKAPKVQQFIRDSIDIVSILNYVLPALT